MRNWTIGLLLIFSLQAYAQDSKNLIILHLNDTHSRIEPISSSDYRNPNTGGVVRLDAYVEEVRKENEAVLLLHCGDIVQGTPYFNMFKGQAEIELMNLTRYDAACLGNHEFDCGLETLKEMVEAAQFPFITTNYDFSGTILAGLTKEYIIFEKDGVKVGVIGLGINPEGLVASVNYEGMKYSDPIESANKTAAYLKEQKDCDLVVCLSHLGYYKNEEKLGDITLAKQSRNIDIILGGHTHTFFNEPVYVMNLDGNEVIINQAGEKGINVGRLDITMSQ